MVKDQIIQKLQETVEKLGFEKPSDIVLSISEDPKFGDYSTNIALQLAKQKAKKSYQSPREVANDILEMVRLTTQKNLSN